MSPLLAPGIQWRRLRLCSGAYRLKSSNSYEQVAAEWDAGLCRSTACHSCASPTFCGSASSDGKFLRMVGASVPVQLLLCVVSRTGAAHWLFLAQRP